MTDTIAFPPVAAERPARPKPGRRFDFTSAEAKARLRRRYRAEARFKAYGIIALSITTTFLVVLLTDILVRGIPAFWQHSMVLDVPVKAEEIDPANKRTELAEQSARLRGERRNWFMRQLLGPGPLDNAPDPLQPIRAGDYFALARDALYDAFPGVEGRLPRRKLAGILSTGAADELRDRVLDDVGLIGQTVRTRLLLSANADLYMKGDGTPFLRQQGRGVATPSGTTGEVTVLTSANDFAEDLVRIKVMHGQARRGAAGRGGRPGAPLRCGRGAAHQGAARGGGGAAGPRRRDQRRGSARAIRCPA